MSDVEVIELTDGQLTELAYESPDPLDGAVIVSVSDVPVPSGGGGQSFTYAQDAASAVWLILHPLPFTPSGIRVVADDGHRLYPKREAYPATGRVRLDFTSPVSGTAYLS